MVWIPLLTCFLGALFGHLLTKNRDVIARNSILDRERDMRRRSFRRFLHYFRGRLERVYWEDKAAVWKNYEELAPEFKGEAALVTGDFSDPAGFHRLADKVGGWPKHEVETCAKEKNSTVYQVLLDSIDELITFTETH